MLLESVRVRWAHLDRWAKAAVIAWAMILLFVCGRPVALARGYGVFPIFARAARNWSAGRDVYAAAGDPYRYSPLVTASFVPLSLLPEYLGGMVWRLMGAAILLGALTWWCRKALPVRLTSRQQAWFFLLIIPLTVGSLNNGQSNPLVLGLLLAAGASVAERRWNLASVFLAVACLFKLYPIAVALLMVAAYPRRLALRLTIALGLGFGVPFLLQDPTYVSDQYAGWMHHLATDRRQNWPVERGYRDLRMLCQVWLTAPGQRTYLIVQLFAAGTVAILCLARGLRRRQPRLFLTRVLGLGSCWMTVFGPATESCTYIFLAPGLAWALLQTRLRECGMVWQTMVFASYALFVTSQAMLWFPAGNRFTSLGTQPFAGLILFGCLVADCRKDRKKIETEGEWERHDVVSAGEMASNYQEV
jgi:hypothetical protein